jgi:hypothetical protein
MKSKKKKKYYVVVENSTKTAHIFKDKVGAYEKMKLSRYLFERLLEKNYGDSGDFTLYVCENAQIKSNSGGKRT